MGQFNIKDKVAVITGGAGVLGGCIADNLAKAGVKIVILDRDEKIIAAKVNTLIDNGGEAMGLVTNVLDKATLEKNRDEILSRFSKIDILLNGDVVGPLSFVSHKDNVQREARKVCKKLQDALPRQHFVTVIQAKSQGRIVSSERIRAYRKDVLSIGGGKSVGGGDISRKKKLLEKQKKGKKRQQSSGKVQLSQEAFNSVISRS